MEHYNPNQAASSIWKYAPVDAANYKVKLVKVGLLYLKDLIDYSKRIQNAWGRSEK